MRTPAELAVGESCLDPDFGTTIKRITSVPEGQWARPEYPSIQPQNFDGTLYLLEHIDHFALYDDHGILKHYPWLGASDEPRWSRDPSILYFHQGGLLKTLNVATEDINVIHDFGEPFTFGKGEGSISQDWNHLPIVTEDRVFVYSIPQRSIGAAVALPAPIESVYLDSDTFPLISWTAKGTGRYQGMERYSQQMAFDRQIAMCNGHKAVTVDADGSPVLIWCNSNLTPEPPAGETNAVVKTNLRTGVTTCLLSLDWSIGFHVSAGNGYVIVDAYAAPDAPPALYQGEILQVSIDGVTPAVRLAKHGHAWIAGDIDYRGQSLATWAGPRRVLYRSNQGLERSKSEPDYCDTYEVTLPVRQIHPRAGRRRR